MTKSKTILFNEITENNICYDTKYILAHYDSDGKLIYITTGSKSAIIFKDGSKTEDWYLDDNMIVGESLYYPPTIDVLQPTHYAELVD